MVAGVPRDDAGDPLFRQAGISSDDEMTRTQGGVVRGVWMERNYLTFTLVSAAISALLFFFGAFLLGLWCGWMWWGCVTADWDDE
jgi:hypothetical protein